MYGSRITLVVLRPMSVLLILAAVASLVVACTTSSPTATPQQGTPTGVAATVQPNATPTSAALVSTAPRSASPGAVASRAAGGSTPTSAASPVIVDNRGIVFGKAVTLGSLNLNALAVAVTNTTD